MSETRYMGHECRACGSRERYIKNKACCACVAERVRQRFGRKERGPHHNIKAKPRKKADRLPIARSDFIKPLTREQLMAGR